VHGDWDEEGGSAFDDRLHHHSQHSGGDDGRRSHFVRLDVTDYESVVNIFDFAWRTYGKVDIAISNAGIQEIGNWFDPELGLEGVRIVSYDMFASVGVEGFLLIMACAV
jgi:NAD(P)-dependent dehydrogenase (short-subunit alcohol dehydrogenase family)